MSCSELEHIPYICLDLFGSEDSTWGTSQFFMIAVFAQVRRDVRDMTLSARVVETALGKEAASLRKQLEDAEEGMTDQIWRKVKAHEEVAKEEIMTAVPVVASTCIAAGILHLYC